MLVYIFILYKYCFLAQVRRRQGRVVKQAVTMYDNWHDSFLLIDIYFYWTRLQSLTQLLKLFLLTLFKRLVDFGDGKKLDRPTKIQKIIVNIKRCWGVLIKRDEGCKCKLTNSWRSWKTEVRSLIIELDGSSWYHVLVCSFKSYLYTRHSRSSSAIKITSFSYQGKMKLSDERSRDCNCLEIEIKRFVDISLVPCNEHN